MDYSDSANWFNQSRMGVNFIDHSIAKGVRWQKFRSYLMRYVITLITLFLHHAEEQFGSQQIIHPANQVLMP